MAGTLYLTPPSEMRVEDAAETFYKSVSFHFDYLWKHLSHTERTVAVILAIMTLQGRVLGSSFNYGEIERADRFGPELRGLAQRGLAEKIDSSRTGWIFDTSHVLVWRGEKWALSCEAFAWWIRDAIVAQARTVPSYEEWLHNQQYQGLLTQKQWDDIKGAVDKLPSWAIRSVAGLARTLWNEIRSTK